MLLKRHVSSQDGIHIGLDMRFIGRSKVACSCLGSLCYVINVSVLAMDGDRDGAIRLRGGG